MKLERSKSVFEGYRCDLTKELDDMSGISKQHYYNMFHHYIYYQMNGVEIKSVLLLEYLVVQLEVFILMTIALLRK